MTPEWGPAGPHLFVQTRYGVVACLNDRMWVVLLSVSRRLTRADGVRVA